MPNGKLSLKQKRFCEQFLIDMNATQAAIRAGYSKNGARTQSTRMLANASIQTYLAELRSQQQERTQITADMVLTEIARVAFLDLPEERYKASDKLKAMELLGKRMGLFQDFNAAIGTLKEYGRLEPTPTGHIFTGPGPTDSDLETNG